jgi:hypothetical protein
MKNVHDYFVNLVCFCLLLVCCFFFSSCKKFLAVSPPETQLPGGQVFNNSETAAAAAVGVYSQMMQTSLSMANGGATLYPALSAGELYNTGANADYDRFRGNSISPASSTGLNRLWTYAYRSIYHANAVMEGLHKSTALADTLKSRLQGEMLVVRALHYFYLVQLFGDVPLVTSTAFDENSVLPRSAVADVYAAMEADLKKAKELLPVAYASAGRVRPNKWTATALLARVYLYERNWAAAEAEASEVINSGMYGLASNLNSVFLAGSNEAIWQLSPVSNTINTAEGNSFIPSSATARPSFAATGFLLSGFEVNDGRKGAWLKSTISGGQTYYYPYKYKVRTGAPPYSEYYMVLRLGEVYLIRAEARAQQTKTALAADDINKIRNRAGLANTTAATQAALLAAVEQERRTELMFEWGHRWLDLKRTGRIDTWMVTVNPAAWQTNAALYPLPQYELDSNPFLVQNPGY